jgi:TonB family protein
MTIRTSSSRIAPAEPDSAASWPATLPAILLLMASPASMGQQGTTVHEISVSPDTTLPHGFWRYHQLGDDLPVACAYEQPPGCITNALEVENASTDTLECTATMNFRRLPGTTLRRVVGPGETVRVLAEKVKPKANVTEARVDCTVRPPVPPPEVTRGCAFHIDSAPSLAALYPPASRRLQEEGSVDVAFTLDNATGTASGIAVIGYSLSPRLDGAAVKFVEAATFSTPCPGLRYATRVRFQLSE